MERKIKLICDGGSFTAKALIPTIMVGDTFAYFFLWKWRLGFYVGRK